MHPAHASRAGNSFVAQAVTAQNGLVAGAWERAAGQPDAKAVKMNHSHAQSLGFPVGRLVSGFRRPAAPELNVPEKPLECDVVMALEERMWRDRREVGIAPASPAGAVGRIRAKVRDFVSRMQLGPIADDVAGRDPESRF
jgi:hypothetical protein